MQCVTFWGFFSLRIITLQRFIQVVALIPSFFFYYQLVFHGVDGPQFNLSPFEGHLCCFQFFITINKVAVNIHALVLWEHDFSCLWDKCSGMQIARLYASCIFSMFSLQPAAIPKAFMIVILIIYI